MRCVMCKSACIATLAGHTASRLVDGADAGRERREARFGNFGRGKTDAVNSSDFGAAP